QELKGKDSSAEILALRDDMEKLGVRRLRDELTDLKRQLVESSTPAPVRATTAAPESAGTEESTDKSAIKKTVRIGNAKPAMVAAPANKGE
ncbi:MAG: hypothetical protein HQL86_04455, partial [Magnetococcales bacterium]|nr:hypothetical protein [Magnetococcales bacterium]